MMDLVLYLGAALHVICMACLMVFGIHRLWLLACWRTSGGYPSPAPGAWNKPPRVTIQLPIYNESRVAGRLIDAAAGIQWPEGHLEIQILDDSTDDTKGIIDERAAFWTGKGCRIQVIRRTSRNGYKAGALENGMKYAKGEFIAIFDADFVPPGDFLEKAIPYFCDPHVGMVQTRWDFLNERYSWLTRIQAMLLSPHFEIEHQVRCSRFVFFNFNGTAGVWRRSAIESAGGWQSDTVTEDLDLSYRAQLAGWRFIYLDSVAVPSELPAALTDFRTQQQRWTQGSIQTARKILPKILFSRLPFPIKMESAMHLLANLCWLFGFFAMMTIYPLVICRAGWGPCQVLWIDIPIFLFSGGAFLIYYSTYAIFSRQQRMLMLVPLLPAFSIGLAPSLAAAVLRGLSATGGRFNRTPKFGVLVQTPFRPCIAGRESMRPSMELVVNMLLLFYSAAPIYFTYQNETWQAIPFLCQFPLGFIIVTCKEICDRKRFPCF